MGGKECFHLSAMAFFIRIGESRIQQVPADEQLWICFFLHRNLCVFIYTELINVLTQIF